MRHSWNYCIEGKAKQNTVTSGNWSIFNREKRSKIIHETEQNYLLYLKSFWWFFLIFVWIIDFCKSSWNIMHYHVTFTLQWKLYNSQENCLCIFLLLHSDQSSLSFLSSYLSISLSHYPFTTPTSLSLLLITE